MHDKCYMLNAFEAAVRYRIADVASSRHLLGGGAGQLLSGLLRKNTHLEMYSYFLF